MPPISVGRHMDSPTHFLRRRSAPRPRRRPNGRVPMEASSTRTGGPKARSGDGLAVPILRAWRTPWASRGLGPSPNRAVGVDRGKPPSLKGGGGHFKPSQVRSKVDQFSSVRFHGGIAFFKPSQLRSKAGKGLPGRGVSESL